MKKYLSIGIISLLFSVGVYSFNLYFPDFLYKWKHPALVAAFDYGILTKKDLEWYYKDDPAIPFNDKKVQNEYWHCLNKKYLKIYCLYQEPRSEVGSMIGIEIEKNNVLHLYGIPHAISGEACDILLSQANKVLKNREYVCIFGMYDSLEMKDGKKEYNWTFERLKTKDGYAQFTEYEGDANLSL